MDAKLEQIMTKIEQNSEELQSVQSNRDGLFAEQKARLAEIEAEKKPKLRHMDYGININGSSGIINDISSVDRQMVFSRKQRGHTHASKIEGIGLTVLGNLDDDLKAMQEDVAEHEEYPIDNECNESFRLLLSGDQTVHMRSNKGCMILNQGQLGGLILKLIQMQATIRRENER